MKWSCLVVIVAILATITPAQADTDCPNGRCPIARVVTAPVRALKTVIVEPSSVPVAVTTTPRRTTVVSAQEHADYLASTASYGVDRFGNMTGHSHIGDQFGYEGIGCSSKSPEDAVRRCCGYGRRVAVQTATSWCPRRRQWVAVIRYK
jgi:hypothetical protein